MTNTNTGYYNTGYYNTGHYNTGHYNTGHYNTGNRNTGDRNTGYYNTGHYNTGHYNTGYYNTGNRNTGYYNTGHYNTGSFNTDCPKMRLFNKDLDITVEEFYKKYNISMDIPLNCWIDKEKMTDEEKKSVSGWETMGGYLKTLPFKDACKIWWKENPKEHDRFLSLPGFDAKIFEEITGINVSHSEQTDEELIKELERRGRVREGKIIS